MVVEDDHFIAVELARSLQRLGVEVVGPVGSVPDALGPIERGDRPLDGAVLDIHLGEERVYPVTDALVDEGSAAPRCEKPVETGLLLMEEGRRVPDVVFKTRVRDEGGTGPVHARRDVARAQLQGRTLPVFACAESAQPTQDTENVHLSFFGNFRATHALCFAAVREIHFARV